MTAVAPRDAYRILAANYDGTPNPLLALDRRTIPDLLPDVAGLRVIDVAAGTGYWASWCAERGAICIATDVCKEMLEHAPRPIVVADAARLPFPSATADITICAFGLGYSVCLEELARITRPGGIVIASDIHPDALLRGWTRSFRHANEVLHVDHHPYRLADLTAPRLTLEALLEPHFGNPERAIFKRAGKDFATSAAHPAIFAARWRRA